MRRRYCGSNTIGCRPVEKRTSLECARTMEKEKGVVVYLNLMSADDE
jgi:hypothetical protein